jgi:hypothetical protein
MPEAPLHATGQDGLGRDRGPDGADQPVLVQTAFELDDGPDLLVGEELGQELEAVPTGQTVAAGHL